MQLLTTPQIRGVQTNFRWWHFNFRLGFIR